MAGGAHEGTTLHDARAVPRLLASRYRIGRVLGTGGMSTVYAARDPLLNRDVAVKVFTAKATAQADLQAQQAEAQLIASLNHYALTTLLDAGVDTSNPDEPQIFLVMEYIPGQDLRERLRQGPLTAAQVCWLGFDLAEALDYVHESGFVHHDIIGLEEVGRDTAFCSTTNPGHGRPWTIPDALVDDRTRKNPLVTLDPNVRSYAAAPLVTRDGHHLGALCVFDRVPREFGTTELENLTDLASMVLRELELRRASRRALFARD